jgi:hypothetical protein
MMGYLFYPDEKMMTDGINHQSRRVQDAFNYTSLISID